MSSRPGERLVEFLARREEDPAAGPCRFAELDPGLARELSACASMERDLSALSLAVRGHRSRAGPFLLLRPLGEGRAGPVYLAEREEDGLRTAVRILAEPGISSPVPVARSMIGWRHEGAVAVLDTGDDWISSEPSFGVPLARVLAALRRDPPRERAGIARPLLRALATVGRALAAAHGEGRRHGGVSSRKIDLDRGGALRVRDFGFDPVSFGSPHHLAPEQAGADGEVGPGTDAFSLAATAFEIASGVPPVNGRTLSGVLSRIRDEAPRPLAPLAPWAAPEVVRAIDAARSRSPAERPGVDSLSDALESA